MADENIDKIIDEMSKEMGYSKKMIQNCIKHLCNWTRQSMINMDYACINWNKFGTFTPIVKRMKDEEKKAIMVEYNEGKKIVNKKLKQLETNGIQSTTNKSND